MTRFSFLAFVLGIALLAVACGGGGGGGPKAPTYAGPANVVIFSAKEADGTYALYSITPEAGATPERLVTEAQPISALRWAPDGTRIAYVTSDGFSAKLRVLDVSAKQAATASESVLPGHAAPAAWSPDGKQVAYIDAANGGSVRFYDIATGTATNEQNIPGTELDWSSQDELAVVSDGNLVRFDPDSGQGERIADENDAVVEPRWSPDGKHVAFSSGGKLYLVKPGDDATSPAEGSQAAWSRDGARLAFSFGQQEGTADIYDMTVSPASAPEQLTTSITLDQGPSWSPDGTRIAYIGAADQVTAFVCLVELGTPGGDCLDLPAGILPMWLAWSLK